MDKTGRKRSLVLSGLLLCGLTLSVGTSYALVDNSSSNSVNQNLQQSSKTVKGTVIDEYGDPVIGATVRLVSDPSKGASTDIDGNFTISGLKVGDKLEVTYVGYTPYTITITDSNTYNVTLEPDTQLLEEVVVVGFGTQKKVNVTGAVTSVSAKELTARPVNNVTDALQGVVPGMNFFTGGGGGALNSNKGFNIRGTGTIGAGSSLRPLVLIDGMEGDINSLNPQDIENISILKDAAASSIYGSRAPGGVILITTKSGKEGKTVVNYNNNFRFLSPLNMPKMANSYEFALYFNDADTQGNMFSDKKLKQVKDFLDGTSTEYMWRNPSNNRWEVWDETDLIPAANTDWLKTHFGNSFSHEHSISINGGSEKIQYYLSGNYLDLNGILNYGDDNKQRYSLNAKINSQLNDWLNIGYSVRFNRTNYDAPSYMNNLFYHNISRYWPILPLKDPNGFYIGDSKVYQLTEGGRYQTENDILPQQLSILIEPIKDWKTHIELNYKTQTSYSHSDNQTTYCYDYDGNPFVYDNAVSNVYEYTYKSNFFNPNIYTEYSKDINGHFVKGMVGFQSELYKNRSISASQQGISSGVPTLNTTTSNPKVSGGYGNWSTLGFFGRLNYNYKDRYMTEINLRYDGSSRFTKEKRWNLFPSFSVGWNIAREAFFEDYLDTISTLKLRASWGELGNQNTDNWYPFYSTMGFATNAGSWLINNKKPNIAWEPGLVSALLTWERTQTTNVGLDVNAFNGRLSLSAEYFIRRTLDMVGPAPELPEILGTDVPKVNNLDMTSKGWELALSWRDQINDFRYGINFVLSDNIVTIDRYPNPSKNLDKDYDGARLGDIWGYTTKGIAKTEQEMEDHLKNVNQNPLGSGWTKGDIMYEDLNGDGIINAGEYTADNSGDLSVIGNTTPRYNFGLNLDAAWKNFDLKVFFQGTLKRDYMPGGPMFWGADGGKWQSVVYKEHLDYFRDDPNHPLGLNIDSYYPRPDWNSGRNRQTQTAYLQNAAYARLKNVTLGYTLPKSLTSKFYVNNLRLFVSGENLLTFTKFTKMGDPEIIGVRLPGDFSKTYPLQKVYSMGLSITF